MIKFSTSKQSFYDDSLDYSELPEGLIEVTNEQHYALLNAINSGRIVFPDLTYSKPKPSQFHTWDGSEWIDPRTPEEIVEYERSIMPQLKPMDFELKLVDFGLYDAVQELINSDIKLKIAYNRVLYFSRADPFIEQARQALGLTHKQIDEMWTASQRGFFIGYKKYTECFIINKTYIGEIQ